jgi:4-hydroxy-3-methylbut-2-en-1-yl diphosphate reductase
MTHDATYYRKGFGLKAEVQETWRPTTTASWWTSCSPASTRLVAGDVTVRLAKEFGFCYGVERAVEYAYQTRRKFPDKRIFLAGEIIHNPHVNAKLRRWASCSSRSQGTRASTYSGWSRPRTW